MQTTKERRSVDHFVGRVVTEAAVSSRAYYRTDAPRRSNRIAGFASLGNDVPMPPRAWRRDGPA
jgi:hypothetical protein